MPQERGRYCARHTLKGIDLRTPSPGSPRVTKYYRLNCNCWDCSYCGPIKAKRYKAAIRSLAESHRLNKFLTLTLDPSKLQEDEDPVTYIRQVFAKFRVYLFRKYHLQGKKISYIAVLEFHTGGGENHGKPHLHILLDTYVEQRWISESWDALGGGHRVWIEAVNVRNAARYLSKYLTKEMLLSAPKHCRRISCSRSITLLPKFMGPKCFAWQLRKHIPIQDFYAMYAEPDGRQRGLFQIIDVQFDTEDFLEAFSIPVSA